MSHKSQRNFCQRMKQRFTSYFVGKRVLDVGSLDINGCNRPLFVNCDYVGLDLAIGKNVDVVSVAHEYDAPDQSFDTIISTEAFEHDQYYELTIKNIIRMLKPGGLFVFTCASRNRAEHGTIRQNKGSSPFTTKIEGWMDYYKNLEIKDILNIPWFDCTFEHYGFECINNMKDLYFFGVKKLNT